ncbi:MAG: AbrB/MazE/SpoVT family DNA-binding domain-containing protein [Verrucomicrobiales bacterium]|nr:AbrB/MazE/SpoVT family DNA-binding domain-containing protein [Verrucomicrobiales bacterium]
MDITKIFLSQLTKGAQTIFLQLKLSFYFTIGNGIFYGKILIMTASATLDKSGRLVLPKLVRDRLHLRAGARLRVEVVGDKLELTEEPFAFEIEQRDDGLPVVVGWETFDALEAVAGARNERLKQLDSPFGE